MRDQNYNSRKKQLMKDLDKSIACSKSMLISLFGCEHTDSLLEEIRSEYEIIIPQIPFIGHKNPSLVFLIPKSRYLAIYRVLRRRGITFEETTQIMYRMGEAELDAIPLLLRRIVGFFWFSSIYKWRIKKRAQESQERQYPGGYVFEYVEGDGRTFDYGIDYTECAGCKFFTQQGVPELSPLMCAIDIAASERFGWGLTRTMTIADGHQKCDFRYKKGGKTAIALSPAVKEACRL
ncbi:MAG: L-2-amino-thiazoline-4-carboxylic acid hydrolase [Acidobacteriota bacterium]